MMAETRGDEVIQSEIFTPDQISGAYVRAIAQIALDQGLVLRKPLDTSLQESGFNSFLVELSTSDKDKPTRLLYEVTRPTWASEVMLNLCKADMRSTLLTYDGWGKMRSILLRIDRKGTLARLVEASPDRFLAISLAGALGNEGWGLASNLSRAFLNERLTIPNPRIDMTSIVERMKFLCVDVEPRTLSGYRSLRDFWSRLTTSDNDYYPIQGMYRAEVGDARNLSRLAAFRVLANEHNYAPYITIVKNPDIRNYPVFGQIIREALFYASQNNGVCVLTGMEQNSEPILRLLMMGCFQVVEPGEVVNKWLNESINAFNLTRTGLMVTDNKGTIIGRQDNTVVWVDFTQGLPEGLRIKDFYG